MRLNSCSASSLPLSSPFRRLAPFLSNFEGAGLVPFRVDMRQVGLGAAFPANLRPIRRPTRPRRTAWKPGALPLPALFPCRGCPTACQKVYVLPLLAEMEPFT